MFKSVYDIDIDIDVRVIKLESVAISIALPLKAVRRDAIANVVSSGPRDTMTVRADFLPSTKLNSAAQEFPRLKSAKYCLTCLAVTTVEGGKRCAALTEGQ